MVQVKITETYDLSTTVDTMGVIGIHTPAKSSIVNYYQGLMMNHKKIRLVGCDVTLACASMLPADPLQIGTEAGSIAPQDMFNPILYTAVSNDSFNTIQSRLMRATDVSPYGSIAKADFDNVDFGDLDQFDLYYGLLADTDGWRKAMPQSGLQMKGLYPIVYELLTPNGINNPSDVLNIDKVYVPSINGTGYEQKTINHAVIRGNSRRMPAINLHQVLTTFENWFPTTYVACIIMPPAKQHKLYYRMAVTWTFEFIELCPTSDYDNVTNIAADGSVSYASDYEEQSSKMDKTTNAVDVKGADVNLIMTSA